MNKPCSLKDIAAECGLSISTVSQILKNSKRDYSSQTTRKRVRETASRLGYRTNYGYRLMRGQRTMTVAILLSQEHYHTREYFQMLLVELMREFNAQNYATFFHAFRYDREENLNAVRDLLARGVEYFVSIGTPIGYDLIEPEIESRGGFQLALGPGVPPNYRNTITVTDHKTFPALVHYMVEKSCGRFCYLHNNHFSKHLDVIEAAVPDDFRSRTCLCKLDTSAGNFVEEAFRAGFEGTERWLAEHPSTRSFLYSCDPLALGGAISLTRHGFKIGEDVWVGGYDNDTAVRSATIPISSISLDWLKHVPLIVEKTLAAQPCEIELDSTLHLREYRPGTREIHEIQWNANSHSGNEPKMQIKTMNIKKKKGSAS